MEIEDILKYTLTLFQDIDKRLSELRNQQSIVLELCYFR